jgi:ribosomal protein L5
MWNYRKYFISILNTNLHEKFHNFDLSSSYILLPTSLIVKFHLGNKLTNKTLLYANRILVERMIGQKLIYVKTKKHHPAFNIAKHTQFGCLATSRSIRMYLFFIYFTVYSLRNLNSYLFLTKKYNVKSLNNTILNELHFGMTKLLYFVILSVSKDWDGFSYVYDNAVYGVDFSLQTRSKNIYVNRITLSSLGVNYL